MSHNGDSDSEGGSGGRGESHVSEDGGRGGGERHVSEEGGSGGRGHGGRRRPAREPPVGGAIVYEPVRGRGHARGRRPMFGRPMTPAEKMRRSRPRKREAMGDEAYAALMKIKYKEYRVSIK